MKNNILICTIFSLLISVVSCNSDSEIVTKNEKEVAFEMNQYDSMLKDLTLAYAKMMQDVDFRTVLKEEVLQRFDGDNNTLHKTLIQKQITENKSVKDGLVSNFSSRSMLKSGLNIEGYLNSIVAQIPNLQVSIPVHCEDWNVAEYIPYIIFLPEDYSDEKYDSIKAFDTNGNYIWVSTKKEPVVPFIVISRSERIDENGERISIAKYSEGHNWNNSKVSEETNLKNGFVSSNSLNAPHNLKTRALENNAIHLNWESAEGALYYQIYRAAPNAGYVKYAQETSTIYKDYQCTFGGKDYLYYVTAVHSSGESNPSNFSIERAGTRTDGDDLVIKRIFITSDYIDRIEGWLKGAPELMVSVAKGNGSSGTFITQNEELEPGNRSDIVNKWWNCNYIVSTWYLDDMSYGLTFHFWERDFDTFTANLEVDVEYPYEYEFPGGASIQIKAGASLDLNWDNRDVEIGREFIKWWDAKNKEYNIGTGFKFVIE